MLVSQKNKIRELIIKKGLDASSFTLKNTVESTWHVTHVESGIEFGFNFEGSNEIFIGYRTAAGRRWISPHETFSFSKATKLFSKWLQSEIQLVVADANEQDLWNLDKTSSRGKRRNNHPLAGLDSFYSKREQKAIAAALKTVRIEIQKNLKLSSDEVKDIEKRLGHLEESVKKLNKFDFSAVAKQVLISIVVDVLKSVPEKVVLFWDVINKALPGPPEWPQLPNT